jgi:hypothetical protein
LNNSGNAAFEKIDLSVTWESGNRVWVSSVSRLGVVHGVPIRRLSSGPLKKLLERTNEFRNRVREGYNDEPFAFKTGQLLHDLIFETPEVKALFQRTRGAAADQNRHLLVRILATPRIVASLPWELILDPEGGYHKYLTLAHDAHVVRLARVRTYPIRLIPSNPPLRMLLILSSPPISEDGDQDLVFDLYEEKRSLLAELTPLIESGLLKIDVEDRPTLENLRSRIATQQRGYHIVHYIGHATPEALLLENDSGRAIQISPDQFNTLLRACPELSLVFFAGCQTAQNRKDNPDEDWPGMLSVTELCVRDVCQMVIGMQAVLPFRTERLFSSFFYKGLTSGHSVADSVTLARNAIRSDEYVGGGLLDWAVPCLFVGGESADNLIDPNTSPIPIQRTKRERLKLDLFEEDREFFARDVELRRVKDFLCRRNKDRALWITGPQGVGKRQLVVRALEEVEELIKYELYVSIGRLKQEDKPLLKMCGLVAELFERYDDIPLRKAEGWSGDEWWDRLIEELVRQPFVIVLSDVDMIDGATLEGIGKAIQRLIVRRINSRLIFISVKEGGALSQLDRKLLGSVKLDPLGWDDVWRWIKRNLPVLKRYYEKTGLLHYFSTFGPDLRMWSLLAEEIARDPDRKLSEVVEIVKTQSAPKPSAPLGLRDKEAIGLLVACAGPDIAGRQKEFATAITTLAAEYSVSGRVIDLEESATSAPLANLLPIPSPFGQEGSATTFDLVKWLDKAATDNTDIVLADFYSIQPQTILRDYIEKLQGQNVLVIAAAGNDGTPAYPAWFPSTLAVGSLEPNGMIAEYSKWDSTLNKPELFAPGYVKETTLEGIIPDSETQGTSIASLHVLAASILIWATDRQLTATKVKDILVSTGSLVPSKQHHGQDYPRSLNLDAALNYVRKDIIKRTLANGPLEIEELIAACGLRTNVTVRIVDDLTNKGILRRVKDTRGEIYELLINSL